MQQVMEHGIQLIDSNGNVHIAQSDFRKPYPWCVNRATS